MRKAEWLLLGLVMVMVVTGILFYPYVPDRVASHWNTAGDVNGYMSRGWGVFLLPLIFIILAAILLVIPHIDPKKENIKKFRKYYDYLIIGLGIFFYYIYLLILLWNIGYRFNFTELLTPPIAALYYFIGMFLPHTEPNWMIGIRTPWTMSSETVWKKTHHAGGVAFKMCGILVLLGTAFPMQAIWFLFIPIAVTVIGLVVYSYVLYEREKR